MLEIKRSNFKENGQEFEYELENGVYLHQSEWNGEIYSPAETQYNYEPVYKWNEETDQGELLGFEERYK